MQLDIDEPKSTDCSLLVSIHPHVENWEEVLQYLSDCLIQDGCVRSSHTQAVLEREREFPTGVELEGSINIALPHAAPEHANCNGIIVCILNQPVDFRQMTDPTKTIPVRIVFMLAAISFDAINYYVEKLVQDILLEPNVIAWLAKNQDEDSIHTFFNKHFFS